MSGFSIAAQAARMAEINYETISAENAGVKYERINAHLKELESRYDRLAIACQAMWELIQEKTELTEEDLNNKISEVDLRDGTSDGKISRQVVDCPDCGRPSNSKRTSCLFCGADIKSPNTFE